MATGRGDRIRAANALFTLLHAEEPLVFLTLGTDDLRSIRKGSVALSADIADYGDLTASTPRLP
jgi:hypothetical protein